MFLSTRRVEEIAEKTSVKLHSPPSHVIIKLATKVSVKDRVVNFWRTLEVFNSNQFGFLEGRPTLTQLQCCFDYWALSRNKSRPTDVIFSDFLKASDSVPHERLLLKLQSHGIRGPLFRWFKCFLTDSKQQVVFRVTYSSWSCVTSGVPQGTILGPILFLIFVNDISSNISPTLRMFADGKKIYRELSHKARDTKALQSDVHLMYNLIYPGHLNGNGAIHVTPACTTYNAQTRYFPPHIFIG